MEKFWRILGGLVTLVGLPVIFVYSIYDGFKKLDIFVIIPTIIIVLVVLWYFLKAIVNAKPKKEKRWDFWNFRNKYNTIRFCKQEFYEINTIIFSDALFRNDVTIDISNLHYMSQTEFYDNANNLEVIQDIKGKYIMRYKNSNTY